METMMRQKRSHANGDVQLRRRKAARIERTIRAVSGELREQDVLDIGTGSGHIASYFARRARSLLSVDVVDERTVRDFPFRQIVSEILPAPTCSVDVVISNHVIEHVDDQLLHLSEIRRVMKPSGICYLATPNRFAVIEPHFSLPFLSWFSDPIRTRYVRRARRGDLYDVQPLTLVRLRSLASKVDLRVEERGTAMVGERLSTVTGIRVPIPHLLAHAMPSFVVTLHPKDQCRRTVADPDDEAPGEAQEASR